MNPQGTKTVDQEPLLQGLREVGLNRYEASVYLGLVTDQNAKVTEISKRTGVPHPKVYQALDSLVEKGFCALGSDSINRYRPIPPGLAVSGHIQRLRSAEDSARVLAQDLDVLLTDGAGRDLWAPPIEIIKGIRQISPILTERVAAATEEILFFGKAPIVPALEITQALWDAGQGGVQLRLLYEKSYLEADDGAEEEVGLYRKMPGHKREVEELPTKLVLIDRRLAFVSITPSRGSSFLLLVLRHQGLVSHFVSSFERSWDQARPLG